MPALLWDSGTAYDFIISLHVLHNAADFGLRPSWAAGVRQRISVSRRVFLEQTFSYCGSGLEWVSNLPQPKNAVDLLRLAGELGPAGWFEALLIPVDLPVKVRDTMRAIYSRRAATPAEREILRAQYRHREKNLQTEELEYLIRACCDMRAAGEQLLGAFQEYHQVFFAEEEERLLPLLEKGLFKAQELSHQMPVAALVENLTHGIRLQELATVRTLVLAPSFWASPLMFHVHPRPDQTLVVYGIRSELQSIVPGVDTPELLVTMLKALADPTRLRILRHLAAEPLSQAELARRLRLRPPTVTHHLQALRLAGLVQVTINAANERGYAPRLDSLAELGVTLNDFLTGRETDE